MRLWAASLALALLAGCGTSSSLRGSQETDYVLISQGAAGGVWRMLRGELETCKVTLHGLEDASLELENAEGRCDALVIR